MFKLNLVTPERKIVWEQELESVSIPAYKGELTIFSGHAPLLSTLEPGIVQFQLKNGERKKIAVSWGYCQVSSQSVNILAEVAAEKEEIDLAVVKDHLKKSSQKLMTETLDDAAWDSTQNEVARLKAEIRLCEDKK